MLDHSSQQFNYTNTTNFPCGTTEIPWIRVKKREWISFRLLLLRLVIREWISFRLLLNLEDMYTEPTTNPYTAREHNPLIITGDSYLGPSETAPQQSHAMFWLHTAPFRSEMSLREKVVAC
jgi:hypothetical protein